MPPLTKRRIDQASYRGELRETQAGEQYWTRSVLWDEGSSVAVGGLGVNVLPSGEKRFILSCRVNGNTKRLVKIGRYGDMDLEQARGAARKVLEQVRDGRDPAAEKLRARQAPTLAALADRFLAEYLPLKADSTARNYRLAFARYLVPRLGGKRLADLTRRDVLALHAELKARAPYQANRTVAALSSAWSWGALVGLVPEDAPNPAKLPKGQHGKAKERRDRGVALTAEEIGRLGAALAQRRGPLADAFTVYLLTGCRPDEVLSAKWGDLRNDGRRLNLPHSKTGQRTLYVGELPAAIIARQCPARERRPGALIFASTHRTNKGGKLSGFGPLWVERIKPKKRARRPPATAEIPAQERIRGGLRVAAGLDETVRIYDAGRHSYTTRAYELGFAEHVVRKLTGHADVDIGGAHGRYRHTSEERLLAAADAVSKSLAADLFGASDAVPELPASAAL